MSDEDWDAIIEEMTIKEGRHCTPGEFALDLGVLQRVASTHGIRDCSIECFTDRIVINVRFWNGASQVIERPVHLESFEVAMSRLYGADGPESL